MTPRDAFDLLCSAERTRGLPLDGGATLFVCARCAGVYCGALGALLARLAGVAPGDGRLARLAHAALLLPLIATGPFGAPDDPWLRALTGALFGLGAGGLLAPAPKAARRPWLYAASVTAWLVALRAAAASRWAVPVLDGAIAAGAVALLAASVGAVVAWLREQAARRA